jgi:xylan 1,4-beta-xylosidase
MIFRMLLLLLVSGSLSAQVYIADPFVLRVKDSFYLYGTDDKNPNEGIPVYSSADLKTWVRHQSLALTKGQSFGTKGFWAPGVVAYKNRYYMYYTANEKIAVATSESPVGPFVQTEIKPMMENSKEIDPHVFIDENGQKYMYFVRLDHGNRSFGAELEDDMMSLRVNTIVECISQSQPWEIVSGKDWPVTEAPAVLKFDGKYYIFYTANDFRSPAYNVGYAVSDSPLGPFKKSTSNPLISRNDGVQGTGGCEFVSDENNNLFMFYHVHNSDARPTPRKTVYSKIMFTAKDGGTELEVTVAPQTIHARTSPEN